MRSSVVTGFLRTNVEIVLSVENCGLTTRSRWTRLKSSMTRRRKRYTISRRSVYFWFLVNRTRVQIKDDRPAHKRLTTTTVFQSNSKRSRFFVVVVVVVFNTAE